MQPHVCQHVFEDSGLFLMARFLAPDGSVGNQADIGSINLKVTEQSTGAVVLDSTNVTVSDVVFDALQSTRWTLDETGYNFSYNALPAHIPDGNKTYVFEFKFTPAAPYAASIFHIVFEVPTLPLFRS